MSVEQGGSCYQVLYNSYKCSLHQAFFFLPREVNKRKMMQLVTKTSVLCKKTSLHSYTELTLNKHLLVEDLRMTMTISF